MTTPLSPAARKKSGLIQVVVGLATIGVPMIAFSDSSWWVWITLWIVGSFLMLSGIGLLLPAPSSELGIPKGKPKLRPLPPPTAAPGESVAEPRTSMASNPGCLTLSMSSLHLFHPYLATGNAAAYPDDAKLFAEVERDWALWRLKELLARGDSRPAVVCGLSDKMIIIGAYSDDFDACVFLLAIEQCARHLVRKHQLQVGSRLIVVNNFQEARPDGSIQADIHVGEFAPTPSWSGVWPVIGDFVSEDADQLAALKANISDQQWQRATDLAFASYDGGMRIRSVHPFRSAFEGKLIS